MNITRPSDVEMIRERFPEKHRPAGPDGLSPSFRDGGEVLARELRKFVGSMWAREEVPMDWCESVIVPISREDGRFSFESDERISFVSITFKLLSSLFANHLLLSSVVFIRLKPIAGPFRVALPKSSLEDKS